MPVRFLIIVGHYNIPFLPSTYHGPPSAYARLFRSPGYRISTVSWGQFVANIQHICMLPSSCFVYVLVAFRREMAYVPRMGTFLSSALLSTYLKLASCVDSSRYPINMIFISFTEEPIPLAHRSSCFINQAGTALSKFCMPLVVLRGQCKINV